MDQPAVASDLTELELGGPQSMPSLCTNDDDDLPHLSWQPASQQPSTAARVPDARALLPSSSSNSMAPPDSTSVPITTHNTIHTTPLDIGAAAAFTSTSSMDIGASSSAIVKALEGG